MTLYRSGARTLQPLGHTRFVDGTARSVPFVSLFGNCIKQLVLAPPRTDGRLAWSERSQASGRETLQAGDIDPTSTGGCAAPINSGALAAPAPRRGN